MSFLKNALLASLVLVLCAVFAMPTLAQDQSSARGNLSGLVYDSSQSLVPGAEITVTGPIGSLTQNTSGQGSFLFSTLIPGLYSVRVQKAGFKVSEVGNVEVLINKTTSVSVTLEPGAVTQVVEVASANLTVDTSASSVNSDLADTFYENVPIQRNVASLFYLAPGVVSGIGTGNSNPGISGSSGLENLYVADGVSINDPAFGGLGVWSRFYGSLGSGINLSFVKEVQVKSGGFEPQYGHASGGIVQIVTKSGGTSFHGALGGYFNTAAMQDTFLNADDPVYHVQNLTGRHIEDNRYEADGEMGGYVPVLGLKDRLFWFGTFNPTWNQARWAPAAGSGLADIYGTHLQYRTFSEDYAGKLTFKINNSNTIETSIFGDPNSRNTAPSPLLLNADNTTVNSNWNYGTRNWDTRYDGAITPTWTIDAAFTWSWNHFTEVPEQNATQIVDQTQVNNAGQRGTFTPIGFGGYEPYDGNTKSIQVDTAKTYHFGGQHTFSVGYNWQFPSYNDSTQESGPRYPIPELNAAGGDPGYDTKPGVVGALSDSQLVLLVASCPGGAPATSCGAIGHATNCTLCPWEDIPQGDGTMAEQRVVLQQTRGRFDSGVTHSTGKYAAAYANDSWAIGTHVTLNAGLRWEQQRLTGNVAFHTFTNMWSPRFGIIVDPKGDRKSKIYANFGRYAFVLPLDLALRSLSTESDFLNPYFAPASTTVGCPAGFSPCVITNADGSPNYAGFFVPDSAHLLSNDPTTGIDAKPNVGVNGGEPYAPGTRFEYTDEFVVGAEHQFRGGIVASARYIDRRLKRVIEDQGGISVEEFNSGVSLNYYIGNPSSKSDLFVNPNEQVFGGSGTCAGSQNGLTSNCTPVDPAAFGTAFKAASTAPSAGNAAALEALGFPAACIDTNFAPTPYVAINQGNTFGTTLGSACFPGVNTGTWTTAGGTTVLPSCTSLSESQTPGACAAFGGEFYPDGKPDTYKDPKREYEAVELEVNKAFSHNWAMVANWRISQLRGNYEGAFRNDNGQADPGISSLFDLTEGDFGLIGQQQGIGPLNTNRKQVVNVYTTYVLSSGLLKNMVLGGGVKVQSGVPLTTLAAQQAYQNPGEVPIYGRGDLGNAPVVGSVDAHIEYPWKINDRFTMKFGMDLFNIADGRRQTLVNEFVDQGFGVPNADFGKPAEQAGVGGFFQAPFQARGTLRLEF
ncbi:MAG: carboxypeptidase regulatory-like domain-containing protein [Candidatus Acidiferrales bacterium]